MYNLTIALLFVSKHTFRFNSEHRSRQKNIAKEARKEVRLLARCCSQYRVQMLAVFIRAVGQSSLHYVIEIWHIKLGYEGFACCQEMYV